MENTVNALSFTEWLFKPVPVNNGEKNQYSFPDLHALDELALVSYEGDTYEGNLERGAWFNIVAASFVKHVIEENNSNAEWLEGLDVSCENLAICVDPVKGYNSDSYDTTFTLTLREPELAKVREYIDLEEGVNYAIRFKLTPLTPFNCDSPTFASMLSNPRIGPMINEHNIISSSDEIPYEEYWHLSKKNEADPSEPFLLETDEICEHALIMVANFINSKTTDFIHEDMFRNIDCVQFIKIHKDQMELTCVSVRFHILGGTYIFGTTASMDLIDEEVLT